MKKLIAFLLSLLYFAPLAADTIAVKGNLLVNGEIRIDNAKGNLLTADSINVGCIRFDTTTTIDHPNIEGHQHYNPTDKTLDLMVSPEVTIQLGQENVTRAVNKTGVDIENGKVVYFDGAQGKRPKMWLADYRCDTAIDVIGMTTEYATNNEYAFVTSFGSVRGLNTSKFSEGDSLWLAENGSCTNIKPSYPNYAIMIGHCMVSSINQGQIDIIIRTNNNIKDRGIQRLYGSLQVDTLTANSSNYTTITADTIIANIYQMPPRWDDLRVEGTNFRTNATALTMSQFKGTEIYQLTMGEGDAGNMVNQMPHSWYGATTGGDTISPHLHFCFSTVANETIQLVLTGYAATINDTYDKYYQDTIYITAAENSAYVHRLASFQDWYLPGNISSVINWNIARTTFGNYSGLFFVSSFDCHIRLDGFGSQEEYLKE